MVKKLHRNKIFFFVVIAFCNFNIISEDKFRAEETDIDLAKEIISILQQEHYVDILTDIKNRNAIKKEILKLRKFRINNKVSSNYFIQFVNGQKIKSFVDVYFFINKKKNNYIIEKHNFLLCCKITKQS